MNPLTREWVEKAEGDFATANRELRARRAPNYDAACFHAQQCAEKYLKAFLQEGGIPFGKTHNLIGLLETSASHSAQTELADAIACGCSAKLPKQVAAESGGGGHVGLTRP